MLYTRCTSAPILLYVRLPGTPGGKLGSLSVSIFQSRRVMSASRRQAVVALTEEGLARTRESIGDGNASGVCVSRFLPIYLRFLVDIKGGREEAYTRVHDFTCMYI